MKTFVRAALALILVPVLSAAVPEGASKPDGARKTEPVVIEPVGRILVQRGFVPFRGLKRCYAVVVGSPNGTHFAYDCASGSLLYLWQGAFADVSEMWAGRAFNQTAVPAGDNPVAFDGLPLFALFPDRLLEYPSSWPQQADPLFEPLGYELDPDGAPAFLARLSELNLRDRIVSSDDGRSLVRTLHFEGRLSLWENWVLLAEGESITPTENGFAIAPGGWSIEWPADAPHRPVVVDASGRRQLRVRLTKETFKTPLTYTLSRLPSS